jgi:DNA-binding HxlR family transcriptional regulator
VRVDYRLTELGHSLAPVVTAIKMWAEANMDQIDVARADYDSTTTTTTDATPKAEAYA